MTVVIITIVGGLSAVANLLISVLYAWKLMRVRRLEILLANLCIKSFVYQHVPIWQPWAEAFGCHLEIRLARPKVAHDADD